MSIAVRYDRFISNTATIESERILLPTGNSCKQNLSLCSLRVSLGWLRVWAGCGSVVAVGPSGGRSHDSTIWEPKSYPVLLSFLAQGYNCPRKALINSNTNLLTAPDPDALINVNTPGDVERVKQLIEEKLRTI